LAWIERLKKVQEEEGAKRPTQGENDKKKEKKKKKKKKQSHSLVESQGPQESPSKNMSAVFLVF